MSNDYDPLDVDIRAAIERDVMRKTELERKAAEYDKLKAENERLKDLLQDAIAMGSMQEIPVPVDIERWRKAVSEVRDE